MEKASVAAHPTVLQAPGLRHEPAGFQVGGSEAISAVCGLSARHPRKIKLAIYLVQRSPTDRSLS